MDNNFLTDILQKESINYTENCPLSQYTTFKIGGAARLAVFPKNMTAAVSVLRAVRDSGERLLVLGNGSNVLVDDNGFDGVAVILTGLKKTSFKGYDLTAEAGVPLTRLAATAAQESLAGLEFAYGIPGSVGGGVFMNAGAYGGAISDVVISSRWFDMKTGETGEFTGDEQAFSYRHSAYMDSEKIVLAATFRLEPGEHSEIVARMNDYMSRRKEKQPLELPSAGSVFKRGNGFITAQLIDEIGLKGRSVGNARVSEKHAGFIVNLGGATAKEVLELIEIVKREVKEKTGHEIECEVRYIK